MPYSKKICRNCRHNWNEYYIPITHQLYGELFTKFGPSEVYILDLHFLSQSKTTLTTVILGSVVWILKADFSHEEKVSSVLPLNKSYSSESNCRTVFQHVSQGTVLSPPCLDNNNISQVNHFLVSWLLTRLISSQI